MRTDRHAEALWLSYQQLRDSGWRIGATFTHPAPQRQPAPAPRPLPLPYV